MRKIIRCTIRCFFIFLIFFTLFFFSADLWCEFYGFPGFVQNAIRHKINSVSPVDCRIAWIRGGIFSGLKFEQLQLHHKSSESYFACTLPQIKCSLNLFSLLGSNLQINSLVTGNVTGYYQYSPDTPVLFFENGFINLQQSRNDTLDLLLNLKTEGIIMQGRCNLANFSPANLANTAAHIQSRLGFPSADSSPDSLKSSIKLFINRLHAYQFGDNDAALHFSISGDLLRPDDIQGQGYFSINTAFLDNITINKCRGHFSLRNYLVSLSDLHLIFGQGEILKANASIDLRKKTVSATCRGDITPGFALHSTGLQTSSLMNNFTFHNPFHIDASITETPWNMRQTQVDVMVNFRNIDIRTTNLHHGSMKISCTADTLTFSDILIAGDFYEQNKITGNITYRLDRKLLSGKLTGDLPLMQILADNNIGLPKLSPRQLQKNHQLSLELLPSPLSLAELNLKGDIRQSGFRIKGRNFSEYAVPFRLQNGILTVDQAMLALPDGKKAAELTCRLNLPRLIEHQKEDISVELTLFALSDALQWEPAMQMESRFTLNLKNSTLALNDGKGKIHVSRLYNTYVPVLNLPQDDILALVTCEKVPAVFTCRIPEFSLKSPEKLVVEGKAEARDGRFNRLTVHRASCDFTLTPNFLSFRNIRATVNQQETLELDLFTQIYPFYIEIKNARVYGRPNLIGNFIFDKEAEILYQNIWKDVQWDPAVPPCFQISHLLYSESDDDLSWELELQGNARIPNARYHDYLFPEINADIRLNLPESLEIRPITISTEDGKIDGYCRLLFDNESRCQFAVNEQAGTLDVLKLLNCIYPDWEKTCPDLRLPEKSKISCRGSFNLDSVSPDVHLSGTFSIPELKYKNIRAKALSGIWNFQNQKLFWDIREAEMKKGHLKCSGIFDGASRSGESQFILTRIPLSEVISFMPSSGDSGESGARPPVKKQKGFVSTSGKIRFYNNWVGKDLLLDGTTHVAIRQADLWSVPLLSSLGRLIAMGSFHLFSRNDIASLGTISELDADVEFHGERLYIPKLYTNGTIIALNGSGEYSMQDDKLNFTVNGEALKSVNILAFFLKPLSWVFQAELTGSAKDPKWTLRTALRKIFSTE